MSDVASDATAEGALPAPSPADAVRRRLVADLRDSLLDQGESLPLRNHAALGRVVTLCRDPSGSARGVALEAARDEAFAALLLRAANSAYSASVSRIGTLTHAIARLGFELVQGLAIMSMGTPSLGLSSLASDERADVLREVHRHSVRAGLVARTLAPSGLDPELALTAGLLHNLGLTVCALFAPKAFNQIQLAADRGEQFAPVEEEVLGFTHAELGGMLAERWSYPAGLVLAIQEHDTAEPSTPLAALIQISDLAVRAVGIGIEPPLPVSALVAKKAGVDMASIADRLAPLLEAQERLEQRMQAEFEHAA
jgi:HD-like signal output (HDOD) protein